MNQSVHDHEKGVHSPFVTTWWLPGKTGTRLLLRISVMVLILLGLSLQMVLADTGKDQTVNDTKLTLELRGESLETALKKIEKLTPFRFVYRSEEVRQFKNLSLEKAERTVDETLSLILENTSLTFRQIKNNILIVRKSEFGSGEVSNLSETELTYQDRAVSGKVLSLEEDVPLPGVSVILKGTQTGAVTDAEGNYRISVPSESAVLVFSFIGYRTMEVPVEGRSTIDIQLESDIMQLGEVVVTFFRY